MGTVTYTLNADDYIAAAKFEMRLQFRKNRIFSLLVMVLLGGLGVALVLDPQGKASAQGFGMLGICVFVYAFFAFRYYVIVPAQIRRNSRQRAPKPVRIEWDETRMISEDEVVKVTGPWPEFTCWLECKEVFILFFRSRRFQVIPKRAFADPAATQSFHDILLRHIGPQGVARK